MDTQSRLILEKLFKTKSINPKNQSKTLIGNDWPNLDNYILSLIDEYSFGVFKKMSGSDIGRWGEMMFEEQFGIKSDPTGLDIKELKADIKTLTRAEKRTKFTGVHLKVIIQIGISCILYFHMNIDYTKYQVVISA